MKGKKGGEWRTRGEKKRNRKEKEREREIEESSPMTSSRDESSWP